MSGRRRPGPRAALAGTLAAAAVLVSAAATPPAPARAAQGPRGPATTSVVTPAVAAGAIPSRAPTAAPSSMVAGGFVNVVAASPDGTRAVAGTDMSGPALTTGSTPSRLGNAWRMTGAGLADGAVAADIGPRLSVASVLWRSSTEVLVATGKGTTGYLFRSTDGGESWSQLGAPAEPFVLNGGNWAGPGSNSHPRATGRLLAEGGGHVYLAALDRLLRVDPASGATATVLPWDTLPAPAATGQAVALAVTPGESGDTTAWVLLRDRDDDPTGDLESSAGTGNGLLRVDAVASANPRPASLSTPDCLGGTHERPDELIAVREGPTTTVPAAPTALYVAWGRAGVFRHDLATGSWTAIARGPDTPATCGEGYAWEPPQLPADQFTWPAIDATTAAAGTTTLLLGGVARGGCRAPATCQAIQRITVPHGLDPAGGPGPRAQGVVLGVVPTLAGSRDPWWHVTDFSGDDPSAVTGAAATSASLGGAQWVTADLDIVSATRTRIVVLAAGRAAVWRGVLTLDASGAVTAASWRPAVAGLSTTFAKGVAAAPDDPAHVLSLDSDWQVLRSSDAFIAQPPHQHRLAAGDAAAGNPAVLAWGPTGQAVVGWTDGSAYANPAPFAGPSTPERSCWRRLPSLPGGLPVTGLTAVDLPGATAPGAMRVVAATRGGAGSNLWTLDLPPLDCSADDGGWAWAAAPANTPVGNPFTPSRVSFAGAGSRLYAFDQNVGVMRSVDAGTTWALVWPDAATAALPAAGSRAGWLAQGRPDELYLAFPHAAFRIPDAGPDACSTASCPAVPLDLGGGSGAGSAAISLGGLAVTADGRVAVATQVPAAAPGSAPVRLLVATAPSGTRLQPARPRPFTDTAFFTNQLAPVAGGALIAATEYDGLVRVIP